MLVFKYFLHFFKVHYCSIVKIAVFLKRRLIRMGPHSQLIYKWAIRSN